MAEKKRILIAGVSGFLGSHLAMYLSRYYHVYGLYFNTAPSVKNIQSFRTNIMIQADFNRVISILRPDVLIQTVGLRTVEACEQHRRYAEDMHVGTTIYLSRTGGRFKSHLIYFSTAEVYSATAGQRHKETEKLAPINVFGHTKKQCEDFLVTQDFPYTVFRLGSLYGVSTGNKGTFLDDWSHSLIRNEPVKVAADIFYTPLLVDDVGKAVRFTIENPERSQPIFNLGGQDRVSPFGFALEFAKEFGYNHELVHPSVQAQLPGKELYGKDTSLDVGLFARSYGFRPKGVKQGLEVVRKRLDTGWTDCRDFESQSIFGDEDDESSDEPIDLNS